MFGKTSKPELVESIPECKTGDLRGNPKTLRAEIALHYPQKGTVWVDLSDSKIVVRETDLTQPVIEDFKYESALHPKKYWSFADEENSFVDIDNQCLKFKLNSEKNSSFAFDLGKIVSDSWKLRYKLSLTQLRASKEDGIFYCFFGLSSHDQTSSANSSQHFLGFGLSLATVEAPGESHIMEDVNNKGQYRKVFDLVKTHQFKIGSFDVRGGALSTIKEFNHNLTEGILGIEIIRNDNIYTVNIYSEAGELLESNTMENSNPINLRYFTVKNSVDVRNSATVSGTISDVKFENEVTN